ncbi:MAG: hypothetical protein UX17_C0046G0010, partial [Parcubacteria group bacterium GW2011_GWC2_45_7]
EFYSSISPKLFDCDVLCLGSEFFKSWWEESKREDLFKFLEDAKRKVGRVVWFDTGDSTGSAKFMVLPYVDYYAKNQVLKDRQGYKKKYYGSRIFTDFYHQQFEINDQDPGAPHLNHIPNEEDLKKIGIGWNYGLANYGYYGEALGKIWHKFGVLPRFYPHRWHKPSAKRPVLCSGRIGMSYSRETVGCSRREIKRLLNGKIVMDRLPKKEYFKELCQSIFAISPFGFGEICYRDFEIIICGSAMIKQNMDHLETWPDLWITGQTYLPFVWNLSDFEQQMEYALQHPQDMIELARNAQEEYKRVLCTDEGQEEFCRRFINIIKA